MLDPRLIQMMRTHCSVRTLSPEQALWFQNDPATELAFVESGTLEVVVSGVAISTVRAGEMIGEASVFAPHKLRTATICAVDEVVVRVCPRGLVNQLRMRHPAAYDLMLDHALITLA